MEIVTPTSEFDFKSITLADPQPLAGHAGFYFTPLTIAGAAAAPSKSLCLQLPECVAKQGIIDVKNAKYLDLMFERDKHDELMHWIERLEYTCQDIIDAKKDLWFQTDLTRDDIETMMTQIIRLYQSGKFMLMRVFIDVHKGGQKCIAYDENEIGYDLDTLEANKSIIPLVMIEGVKFSARSFEIVLKLVQVMVLGTSEKKSSCLIKRTTTTKEQPLGGQSVVLKTVPLLTLKKQVSIAPVQQPVQAQIKQQQQAQVPLKQTPVQVKQTPVQVQMKQQQPQAPVQVQSQIKQQQQQPVQAQAHIKQQQQQALIKHKQVPPPLVKETLGAIKPIIKNTTVGNTTVGNTTVGNTTVLEKNDNEEMEEITIHYDDISDSINLKAPNDVYYEMYKKAREKAKQCRINAIEAYLEAKQIKTKYMLDVLDDDSDEEEDSEEENYNVEESE
jgi:hypothetical protein